MGFLQIKRINLNLDVKNSYRIVHISDTHAIKIKKNSEQRAIDSEKAWYNVRRSFADHFKEKCLDKQMIPSAKCLHKLINYANSSAADVVVLSGDIIDYYNKDNYQLLEKEVSRINKPYVFVVGNHETFQNVNSDYDIITNNQSDYGKVVVGELCFVSLDDTKQKFSEDQYEFLLTQTKLYQNIIIVIHEPIATRNNHKKMKVFEDYYVVDCQRSDEITKKTLDLLCYNENIKLILCGHVHGYHKSSFAKNKYQICCSSGLIGKVNNILIKGK